MISFLEVKDAKERFDLKKYDPMGSVGYDAVVLVEGDFVWEGNLNDATIGAAFFDNNRKTEEELIIIKGDLIIEGNLAIYGESGYPSLLVLGEVHCNSLFSYDNLIQITGDAHIQYLFYGNYNHGEITIEGTTYAPYIVNSDHVSDLNPSKEAVLINSYNNYDDSFKYHYYRKDLTEVLVEDALYGTGEDLSFDIGTFEEFVAAGKNPFKEGATPSNKV